MKFDQRLGTILSVSLHLIVLVALVWLFRNPIATQIVAAGEGQGSGESVIEVGTIAASQLGFTQPRAISHVGDQPDTPNDEVVETEKPKAEPNSEVLPSNVKPTPTPKEKLTNRPTANQASQVVSPTPLHGSSSNKNVEVGRTFGSAIPSMSNGVGVGAGANLGAGGVPGGSEYGRRIQMILSRNYNPPAISDASATQYVKIQLRIARDGKILSVVNGRLLQSSFKQRSSYELVNNAVERAILAAAHPGLPEIPNGFLMGTQEAVAEVWFRYPK
ncbi:MAG: TonB C-terminal domain-containing protein [Acidobacteriota bacterium]|nr:TonB C-terminal domain-containing protein [Acidobacteriota bacterium]